MRENFLKVLYIVGIFILLSIPVSTRADLVTGDPGTFTFENQQKLTFLLTDDAGPLATSSLEAGSLTHLSYLIGRGTAFATNDELLRSLEDQRTYFEVWSGEPFTTEAAPIFSEELTATTSGSVSFTLPTAGNYFVVAYQTNEVRDEASYCLRYYVAPEDCADPNFFVHFPHESTEEYFKVSHTAFEDSSDAWPTAFAGTRITSVSRTSSGVSNVVFLPGIKGTNLYYKNPLCIQLVEHCDIPLWLPVEDTEVPQLFMNVRGKSIRNDLYVKEGDLLSEALGEKFYASFIDMMDTAQATGKFGGGWQWRPIAYDWRLSLQDIVNNGIERDGKIYYEEASDTPYIEQSLRQLASSSSTGKVSIIAHSNGGLVAKALMQKLGNEETSRLIDKVIFVGVPQSGAPRAFGALLYGDQEGLPGIAHVPNFLMSVAHARQFAENSPMAYHLLPSNSYFNTVAEESHPLIQFNGENLLHVDTQLYGTTLWGMQEMESFGEALAGDRTKPDPADITAPNVLNASLLDYGRETHNTIDRWQPPAGVNVYQIAGFGAETISGIQLYEQPHTGSNGALKPTLEYRPLIRYGGDGTVPIESGLMMDSNAQIHKYWENLQPDEHTGHEYTHGDLFEIPEVRELLAASIENKVILPPSIYSTEPLLHEQPTHLFFFLHSPASLTITDSQGNQTSIDSSGVGKKDIPDSEYDQFGEVKYVRIPGGEAYHLQLHGEAVGTATLDLQTERNGEILTTSTISDIPLTPSTIADADISPTIASSSALLIDENGDGTVDLNAAFTDGTTTFPTPLTTQMTVTGSSSPKEQIDITNPRSTHYFVSRIITSIERPLGHALLPVSISPLINAVKELKIASSHITSTTSGDDRGPTTSPTIQETPPSNYLSNAAKHQSLFERFLHWMRVLTHRLHGALSTFRSRLVTLYLHA